MIIYFRYNGVFKEFLLQTFTYKIPAVIKSRYRIYTKEI